MSKCKGRVGEGYQTVTMSMLLWKSCRVATLQWWQDAAILAPEIWGRFGKLHSSCPSAGCWRMASAQAFGTTLNWFALVGCGDGSLWECKSRAGSKTVSALWCKFSWWCWAHNIWLCCNGCWAAEAPVFVCTWENCFSRCLNPGPNRIGCFCARFVAKLAKND